MGEYIDELRQIYEKPDSVKSRTAEEWFVALHAGNHSHRDIVVLVAERDAARNELNRARKIIEVYEDHMDTFEMRCAQDDLKEILTED